MFDPYVGAGVIGAGAGLEKSALMVIKLKIIVQLP